MAVPPVGPGPGQRLPTWLVIRGALLRRHDLEGLELVVAVPPFPHCAGERLPTVTMPRVSRGPRLAPNVLWLVILLHELEGLASCVETHRAPAAQHSDHRLPYIPLTSCRALPPNRA